MLERTFKALKSTFTSSGKPPDMLVEVLELATDENLNEAAYLSANLDVQRAGISASEHLRQYGKAEGRYQFSASYSENLESYFKEKFNRFEQIIAFDDPPSRAATFPITFGNRRFTLDDYVHESANPGFGPFDEEVASNPDRLYVDIGCGLRAKVARNCLYIEVYPSRTADIIVEPSCRYPIKSSSVDGVGCFAVLEHTQRPWLVAEEIHRILKPGGKAFIDWPFLQPVHGYPSHYYNATREGLRSLFVDNGFDVEQCETGAHQTPAYTVRWILHEMLNRLPDGEAKDALSNMKVGELAQIAPRSEFWLRLMDQLPDSALSEFACGNWVMAVKK